MHSQSTIGSSSEGNFHDSYTLTTTKALPFAEGNGPMGGLKFSDLSYKGVKLNDSLIAEEEEYLPIH